MNLINVQDESQHKMEGIYPISQPIKINSTNQPQSTHHLENAPQSEIAFSKESSQNIFLLDGYHDEDTPSTIEKLHNRKQKKGFFERIGLKKKLPQSQYATTLIDELEERPQLSDEELEEEEEVDMDEDESCSSVSSVDDEEEEEEEEEKPVPQISVSSPTLNSAGGLIQPSPQNQPCPFDGIGGKYMKTKTKHKKYNQEFSRLMLAQTIYTSHLEQKQHYRTPSDSSAGGGTTTTTTTEPSPNHPYGALWVIRFSKDGKYLASAGQSCVILLWRLLAQQQHVAEEPNFSIKVLDETPYREFKGHTADILDLAWSKNNFLLSSSMDNTVRLWHTTQKDCLCVFQHLGFVTSIEFHPKDDRFFLSGSMDGRIRIWSISEKRVAFWNEIPDNKYATAVGFTLDGKTVIAGSHDGHCYFFDTQSLKYNTQISVLNDTANNRNSSSKKGPKITGIEVMPGLPPGDEKILITSNDSRVRLYNMKDKSLMFKYKGVENSSLQIKATFSDDGRYIISGSEDCHTYIWRTEQSSVVSPLHQLQETRSKAISALGHVGESTLSSFTSLDSSQSSLQQKTQITKWLKRRGGDDHHSSNKIRSRTEYFEAHDHVVTAAIFAPTKTRQQIAKSKQDTIYNHTPFNLRLSTATSSSTGSSCSFFNHGDEEIYPDGHIIITADYRGVIKVWRIDSGSYTRSNSQNNIFDTQSSLHASESSLNTNSSSSSRSIHSASPKVRRNFGGLFGSRHPK